MLNLIKLEIKRNRLKGYITAGLLITFAVLGLVYLFAAIPHLDASDTDVQIFITYNGIATLSLVVATACFSILSSAMYNRFIVEEYASKKVFLLQTVDKVALRFITQSHFSFIKRIAFKIEFLCGFLTSSNPRFDFIFANFFKFIHANVNPTFISIRVFPYICVYRKP